MQKELHFFGQLNSQLYKKIELLNPKLDKTLD